jgi:hypothetical protein
VASTDGDLAEAEKKVKQQRRLKAWREKAAAEDAATTTAPSEGGNQQGQGNCNESSSCTQPDLNVDEVKIEIEPSCRAHNKMTLPITADIFAKADKMLEEKNLAKGLANQSKTNLSCKTSGIAQHPDRALQSQGNQQQYLQQQEQNQQAQGVEKEAAAQQQKLETLQHELMQERQQVETLQHELTGERQKVEAEKKKVSSVKKEAATQLEALRHELVVDRQKLEVEKQKVPSVGFILLGIWVVLCRAPLRTLFSHQKTVANATPSLSLSLPPSLPPSLFLVYVGIRL